MTDYLDREPGMYAADGGAHALVEQQRASIIELLRTAKAVSVTAYDEDGDGRHWGIFLHEGRDAGEFLVYVAVKALRDAAAALDMTYDRLVALLLTAIEEGIGE